MLKKLFGVAAMAAVACAVVPAHAANTMACSGANLEKTESATEAMADGPGKFAAEREIAQAQEALLGGNMRSCAMHLSRASHRGPMGYDNPGPGRTHNRWPIPLETDPACALSAD